MAAAGRRAERCAQRTIRLEGRPRRLACLLGPPGRGRPGAGGGGAPGRGRGVRHCQSHMRVPESQAGIRPGSASAARLRPRPAAAPGPAFDPGDDDRPALIHEHSRHR